MMEITGRINDCETIWYSNVVFNRYITSGEWYASYVLSKTNIDNIEKEYQKLIKKEKR